VLKLHAGRVIERLEVAIREIVHRRLRRRGAVLGMSGGIDSSVCAALCAGRWARTRPRLFLPEADSATDSLRLGRLAAEALGVDAVVEDITPILRAAGCYERRDAAIRQVIPEYGSGWKSKLTLPEPGGPTRLRGLLDRGADAEGVLVSRARLTDTLPASRGHDE